jgi:hypothetical protein
MRTTTIGLLLLLGATSRLLAQTTSVTGIQPLAFGMLLPGVPTTILPTDPVNSGRFDLAGRNKETVSLTFTLPSSLVGPGGATLPVTFGGSSAGFSATQSTTDEVFFDPTQAYQTTLGKKVGSVFLGATAQPSTSQRAGPYSATVTLSVVFM